MIVSKPVQFVEIAELVSPNANMERWNICL